MFQEVPLREDKGKKFRNKLHQHQLISFLVNRYLCNEDSKS